MLNARVPSVNALVKIPDGVTMDEAAAATCATGTVVHALRGLGRLQPGQTVLVTGAAGAAAAIPLDGQPANHVKKLTGGEGADIVLAAVGTPAFDRGFKALTWGGRMIVIGNVMPVAAAPLALGSLILREIAILGCMNTTRDDLTYALQLIADKKLTPLTPTVLPLQQASRAHQMLRERVPAGKIILKP